MLLAGIPLVAPAGCVTVKVSLFEEPKPLKEETISGHGRDKILLLAQAGDTIMAYPTCITGSIGFIAMKFNLRGLMDKVGVDTDVVKTGVWKDFWSPFRPASPKEKEMMQQIIEEFYRKFLTVVAQGLGLWIRPAIWMKP